MATSKRERLEFDKPDLVPAFTVLREQGGYNAEILYAAYPDGRLEVTAQYGAKKGGFTYNEALEKYRDLVQYQAELVARKIPLPRILKIVIEYDHAAEKAMVLKTSTWTGKDVHCLLEGMDAKRDKRKILSIVAKMCRVMLPLLRDRLAGWETKVGIDPRCSNFTLDGKGRIWFVDLFPPRYRKQGQPIIEWPEPKHELGRKLGYFKHYDVRGIILCTIAQLARVKPQLKSDFERVVVKELARAMSRTEIKEFKSALAQAPWVKVRESAENRRPKAEIAAALRSAADATVFGVPYYVYSLREIALEFARLRWLSTAELEDFFRRSHFEDELPAAVIKGLIDSLEKRIR